MKDNDEGRATFKISVSCNLTFEDIYQEQQMFVFAGYILI